jgi:hypothetical protein
VLWKHYSSWFLGAIVAVGTLHQFGLEIEGLPRWVTPVLAVCALVAKLVPQSRLPTPVSSDPSYGELLDEARK